jgi:predicted Zn-dependent protease
MLKIFTILLITSCMPSFAANNALPSLGDAASGLISMDQEHRLGRIWLRNLRQQATTLHNPVLTDYTENLIYRLASNSQVSDRRLEIVLLDNKELNAFAVPGGVIGINAGLFLHAKTEDQFSAVLAHELAHLSQRHFARQVEESRKQAPIAMATILGSILLLATNNTEAGFAGLMTSQAAASQWALSYSRDWEREADRLGLHTLVSAEINPQGMPDMFRQMFDAHKYSERPPEFLLTHPVSENRISDAAGRVDNLNTSGFTDSLDYQLMRTAIQVQYQKESHNLTSYQKLISKSRTEQQKQIAHYGLALILADQKKYRQALTHIQVLLAIDSSKISYLTLKHLINFKAGYPEQALKALADLIEINPDNHSLVVTYATLLAKNKQFRLAADELKKHSRVRPSDPSVWQKLSEYESKAKNDVGMLQAHAEFLFLTGQKKQALNQLKRALELSKGEYLTSARIEQRAREIDKTNNDMSF